MSAPVLFRSALGEGTDWHEAAAACAMGLSRKGRLPSNATFGLVYVTEALAAHLGPIAETLAAATGVVTWAGCVGTGICGTASDGTLSERHGGHVVSAMIGTVPPDAVEVLESLLQPEEVADCVPEDWDDTERPILALVHGDPRNAAVSDIISVLPDVLDGYLVGGLTALPETGGRHAAPGQYAGGTTGGGLSGLLFSSAVPVSVGLTQGCRPLGPPHRVSSMDGDWVAGLDGKPALDALKADLGPESAAELRSLAGHIHAAVPVEGSDTKDYLVRTLMAIDPNGGRLGISSDLSEGDRLMFVRRDPAAAEEDLRRMVRRLVDRLDGKTIRGALYVSCLARGPNLFDSEAAELGILQQELGTVPLTGFFAGGEINHDRLYAYTGVLTLFL